MKTLKTLEVEMLTEQQWQRLRETNEAQRKEPQDKKKHGDFVEAVYEAGRSLNVSDLGSQDAWNRILDRLDELRPDWRGYVPGGYAVSRRA